MSDTAWNLVEKIAQTCETRAKHDTPPDLVYPKAFGALTGVLTMLPDTPENRSFLEKWLENNKEQ